MPSSTELGSCSRVLPILPRPSARSVPRWRSLWPIWLRTWVIFTFATLALVLLLADAALLRRLGGRSLGLCRLGCRGLCDRLFGRRRRSLDRLGDNRRRDDGGRLLDDLRLGLDGRQRQNLGDLLAAHL